MHLFSIYYQETYALKVGSEFTLKDSDIYRRVVRVLRLRVGQTFVLFDRNFHSAVSIRAIKNDSFSFVVLDRKENKEYTPKIIFLLPILKRDALEEAISGLVALGVQSIQLVITSTIQRKWYGDRELSRLHKIVISTAEQSRNYAFPLLKEPVALQKAIDLCVLGNVFFMYADPAGASIANLEHDIAGAAPHTIVLTVGPEADFSTAEKELLHKKNVFSYRLTPTILRSPLAATLLAGMCRSVLP